jgi:MATE family, multidrug efflux pump
VRESELGQVIALALPLAAANLGQMLLSAVSTAVVGRVGALELGAVGLGGSVFFTVLVFGMGMMLALDPLAAQAFGDGDPRSAGRALWQGVWLALVLSLPLAAVALFAGAALERLGIDAATAAATRDYLRARVPGIPFYLWFIAARSFLGAEGRTRDVLVAVAIANAINVPLSLALVLGVPALGVSGHGVAGAGWAATLATIAQLLVLAWAVRRSPHRAALGPSLDRALAWRALVLGLPVALALLAEFGVFALVNFLVGRGDPRSLAAHQVAITIASTTFMVPVGIAAAAAARVGRAVGRGDARATRTAGLGGLGAGAVFMLLAALLFLLAPRALAGLLSSDRGVIDRAAPLIGIAALFQLSDGVQAVAAGALRGAGDTRAPLVANLVGHYLVGLPLGIALCFGLGLGARGLWWGLSAGLSVVAFVLALRFIRASAKPLPRV